MAPEIKADIESLDAVRRKLTVTVPAGDVDSEFEKTFRDLQKRIVMPGFRRGHVPMTRVRQTYAAEVRDDVARELISRAYAEALEKTGAHPVNNPDIKEFHLEAGRDLTFTAEFEARPEINLPAYKGLKLVRKMDEVTDEDVDKVLEDLRRRVAPVQDITDGRAIRHGDIAVIDFEGHTGEDPIPGGTGTDFPLEIGSGTFIPGFEDALVGAAAGEKKTFSVTMPGDYRAEDLAGKDARFAVTVKSVKERVPPALDDDFARDVGDHASLDDLKGKIRDNLASVREREARAALRQEAVNMLLGGVDFTVPPSLIEEEERNIVHDYSRRLTSRGLPPEETEKQMQAAQGDIKAVAMKNVKVSLVLAEIARRETLKVERADLDRALRELAERYKKPVAELRKEMIKSGAIEHLSNALIEDKVFEYLVDNAEIDTQPTGGK